MGAATMRETPALTGGLVGIVAPASPFDAVKFETGLRVLRNMGVKTIVPDSVRETSGYLAGPDQERARLINELFSDPEISAVWCARGGYGSMRVLPLLDYELLRLNPKPFVGASDVTALLAALYSRCRTPVFHGPMIVTLADADEKTCQSVRQMFFGTEPLSIRAEPFESLRPGIASGKVIGGNLTTLAHLIGTPFEPDFFGHLLFIEDIGEAPYRIDRMMTQLKMAGKLSGISGLLLGRFSGCGPMEQIHSIMRSIFEDLDIPMLSGIPAGHGLPNLIVPMGISATMDADQGLLSFHDPIFTESTAPSPSG